MSAFKITDDELLAVWRDHLREAASLPAAEIYGVKREDQDVIFALRRTLDWLANQ